ncbi:MAG: nitrogen fixation protein NifQ [Rhodocyclaceae bacterium]|nr:nitrogen fixation protein NifQ [Rhodocyclaceae bacterium]
MNPEPNAPLAQARRPGDLATVVFAGVIAEALRCGRQPLIRGLSEARFQKLLNEFFFCLALTNGKAAAAPDDEFDDLVELLLEHRVEPSEQNAWLAYAVASSAMGANHLWQDMGLPSRKALSELMREHFPALAAANTRDMKWKKFFYRQLCGRAGVPICKSPHCADCCDYAICFGAED